jgi:hypothetical protein
MIMRFPLVVFLVSLLVLWLATRVGAYVFQKRHHLEEIEREDFAVIEASTLTLLALLLGFSFSMAISRYDQRKNNEEAEANAIATEYLRADLLPAAKAANVRILLKSYLAERILFYESRWGWAHEILQIKIRTDELEAELWSAVRTPAATQPTPITALVVAGMNDVLNSRGNTQAEWLNRIPLSAWAMMGVIAICGNIMVGYGARRAESSRYLFFVLPLIVSISFLLIADIDSPRGGLIHVKPQNLEMLSQSLQVH